MSDWTDQILDAIQRVSILDYRKDEATGRPSKVGEQTAAMIFNAVRAAEGRAIDPAEDCQTSNNDDRSANSSAWRPTTPANGPRRSAGAIC